MNGMIAKTVSKRASTELAAPIVFVPTEDGSMYHCVYYRMVNAVAVFCSCHLSQMDEYTSCFREGSVRSTLEAK